MPFSKFKGGLLPKRVRMDVPALSDYLPAQKDWPAVKPRGWEGIIPDDKIGMLQNDMIGDCVIAAMYHAAMVETWNAGNPLTANDSLAIATYSVITGYRPGDPSTDNGTVWTDALEYWRKMGIVMLDTSGKEVIHKIVGWTTLDPTSVAQMRYSCDVFGGNLFGIDCPQSAEDDQSNWVYVPKSPILGGHGINQAGQGGAGGHIMSWGKSIPFTWQFAQQYLSEAYAVISEFWLEQNGTSPSGLNLDGLLSAMANL